MGSVDVVVVGAGPAGVAAAVELRRRGRSVLLADRAAFPRDKCCGDGLTALALAELERIGLDPHVVDSWAPQHRVVLHGRSGRQVAIDLPPDGWFSVVARRRDLDAALVATAVEHGAELREGAACTAVDRVAGGLAATIGGEVVRTRYVVAADGMYSPVRKLVDARHPARYRGEWHALRQYVTDVAPEAARTQHVWFLPELGAGYVWSFPLPGGAANVGFGVERGGPLAVGELGRRWKQLLAHPAVASVLGPTVRATEPVRAWPIPARIGEVSLSAAGGRVLFVGDAAAAADPMTGEGIGQALVTGRLAAEAIDRCGPDRPAGERYGAAVGATLVADDRMARLLMGVLRRPRAADLCLAVIDAGGFTRRNFGRWMFEAYPRALIATPRRWHRGALTGPGAYRRVGTGVGHRL
jgi:menaquinone-9 beta-reductase